MALERGETVPKDPSLGTMLRISSGKVSEGTEARRMSEAKTCNGMALQRLEWHGEGHVRNGVDVRRIGSV